MTKFVPPTPCPVRHDFDVVTDGMGQPTHVLCSHCGQAWTVRGTTSGNNLSESTARVEDRNGSTEPSGT